MARFALVRSCTCFLSALLLLPAGPSLANPFKKKPAKDKEKAAAPETKFVQVAPVPKDPQKFVRSTGQKRAVVLIHGYWLHFKQDRVAKAFFKDWQTGRSPLVKALAKDSDVFAFAYGQTICLEDVTKLRALRDGIARLKKLGYTHIALVGHSAGGLVAREFVEDFPKAGVTKVIQVGTPNAGTPLAEFKLIPKNHRDFVRSLSKAGREKCLLERADKKIPKGVQFVCVVTGDDYLISCKCQWSPDLQDQGIPAVRLATGHRAVMRKRALVEVLAKIVRDPYTRWGAAKVAEAKKTIFKPKKMP
jgi:pimeloyl-ACP methyl ester carboxylesterase